MKSSGMSWEIKAKCSNLGLLLKRRPGNRNKAKKKTTGKMKICVRQKHRVGLMYLLRLADCSFFVLFRFPVVRWYWRRYRHLQQQLCMPLHEAAEWCSGMLKTANTSPAVRVCSHNYVICRYDWLVCMSSSCSTFFITVCQRVNHMILWS